MNTFFKLNSHKLKFAATVTVVAFLSLEFVVSLIASAKGYRLNESLIIAILLVSIIAAPIFILSMAYFVWVYNRFRRNQIFSKSPFNKLDSIGFYKSLKNEGTKWHFTEEIWQGEINGFKINCDLSEEKNNAVEFTVLSVFRQIDKSEYRRLEKLFDHYNGYFKFDAIAKSFSVKQAQVLTIEDLRNDLQKFSMILKQEGFEVSR
jgi:hypothetical protein